MIKIALDTSDKGQRLFKKSLSLTYHIILCMIYVCVFNILFEKLESYKNTTKRHLLLLAKLKYFTYFLQGGGQKFGLVFYAAKSDLRKIVT